jgi:hypothetical protein
MRSTEGIARSSSEAAEGNGMCGVVMRTLGPSRSQKASSSTIDDLGAPTAQSRVLLDCEEPAGLRNGIEDRPGVERDEGPQVDHLQRETLPGEPVSCLEGAWDHQSESGDGDIRAFPHHFGRPQLVDDLTVGDLRLARHERLVLEEDNRVGIADRGGHEPNDVGRGRRGHHFQARDHHRPVLHALGVLGAKTGATSVGGADHEGEAHLTAGHVTALGDLVRDDVPANGEKVGEHDLGDDRHPGHGRPHRRPQDRLLGDRGVPDALGPELVDQADRGLEHATGCGDVLAQHHQGRVASHLLGDAVGHGVPVAQFRHAEPPSA